MKILFAISDPISIVLLKGQAKFNKAKGAELFLATSFDERYISVIEEEGFVFEELAIEREISLIKDLNAVFAAIKIINKVKPDVVNASTPKAGLIFMIACLFTKVKLPIFTLRGFRSITLNGLKGFVVRSTEWLSCFLAKKVIIISPSLREYAVQRGLVSRKKAIVIGKGSSNGINVTRFNPDRIDTNDMFELKKEWGIPKEAFVFGFLGRIVIDKGVVETYRAFQQVKNKNVFLVLVGQCEVDDAIPKEVLEEMQNDSQVRFIPFSNNVPLVISVFDVLILFSYREGFGNVALEGSCMRKPILIADIIGLCDTVENEVTGFKIKVKDSEALAVKMKVYLEDVNLRLKHGENGRKRVLEHFDSNFIHSELYKIYQSGLK